jgi:hypothetical protein
MRSSDLHDPRPAGIDARTGVWVLFEDADDAVLWSWLAAPLMAKVIYVAGTAPPAVAAEFHERCVEEMLRAGRGETCNSALAQLDASWARLRAAGWTTLVGRHGLWSVLALAPRCATPCLMRVRLGTQDGGEPTSPAAG